MAPATINELILTLVDYPELYNKLFPLDKLERLYKTYIGTDLPNYKTSNLNNAYLIDFMEYRLLELPPPSVFTDRKSILLTVKEIITEIC